MKALTTLTKWTVYLVVLSVVVAAAGLVVSGRLGYISPIKPYVVLSGSMEPTIPTGSVVLVQPDSVGYGVGDAITFSQGTSGDVVTHRITEIVGSPGQVAYRTKGDANKTIDAGEVDKDQVVGKVLLTAPYVGYGVDFAKKPYGFILLVIVPATIIIYEELKNIWQELRRLKRKKPGDSGNEKQEVIETVPTPPSATAITPVLTGSTAAATIARNPEPSRYINAPSMPLKYVQSSPAIQAQIETAVEEPVAPPKLVTKPERKRSSFGWLGVVPTAAVILLFVGVTGSFFSDTEISLENMLGAAETWAQVDTATAAYGQGLVINEVLVSTSCQQTSGPAGWIEVYNGTDDEVDLTNYQIKDGEATYPLVFATSILPSKELVVLAQDTSLFGDETCFEKNSAKVVAFGSEVDLAGEFLQLLDERGKVVDTVTWGDSEGLELGIDEAIERVPRGYDTADGIEFGVKDFMNIGIASPGY